MYKLSINLEIQTKEQRDQLLRDLRSLFMHQPIAIEGKVKVSHEETVIGGLPLSLFGFGVETPTPVEEAINDLRSAVPTGESVTLTAGGRSAVITGRGEG